MVATPAADLVKMKVLMFLCVVKVNGLLREARDGRIKYLDPLYGTQEITAWRLFMTAASVPRTYLPAMATAGKPLARPFVQITTGMAQIQLGLLK